MIIKEGPIFLISSINKEIDFLFSNFLNFLNITKMESIYLGIIYQNPGITQYSISSNQNIEKSLVTKYIKNLERKGFIEKRQLSSKSKGLYLTERGIEIANYLKEFSPKLQELFSTLFTPDEKLIFIQFLKKLKSELEKVNERELTK